VFVLVAALVAAAAAFMSYLAIAGNAATDRDFFSRLRRCEATWPLARINVNARLVLIKCTHRIVASG
jgi:hypothetical protein